MSALAWVAAVLLGACGASLVTFLASWAVLNLNGELGDTPGNRRREVPVNASFGAAAITGLLALAGLLVGGVLGQLPEAWGWLSFAGIALVVMIVGIVAGLLVIDGRR